MQLPKHFDCIFAMILILTLATTAKGRQNPFKTAPLICIAESELGDYHNYSSLCFRGRPGAYCKSFLITEAAYLFRITKSGYTEDNNNKNFYFLGELGYMWNLDRDKAIGLTLYYGFDDDGSELAIKPRFRKWLNSSLHLDASLGIIFWNFSDINKTPGFIVQLNLGYGDYISLFTQFNLKKYRDSFYIDSQHIQDSGESEKVLYAGLKMGSYPGSATLIIAPLSIFIWYIVTFSD